MHEPRRSLARARGQAHDEDHLDPALRHRRAGPGALGRAEGRGLRGEHRARTPLRAEPDRRRDRRAVGQEPARPRADERTQLARLLPRRRHGAGPGRRLRFHQRTPIPGLYQTGATTHPGGSVTAAPAATRRRCCSRISAAAGPLADERLDYVLEAFTWRITASVPPWDFAQIVAELESYDDWCRVWSRWAARHEALGDAAAAAGRGLTAGDAYVRAALFYHWASFLFTERRDSSAQPCEAMDAVWAKAAPHVGMERVETSTARRATCGGRPARAARSRPPGVDSTKEEFFGLTSELVDAGSRPSRRRARAGIVVAAAEHGAAVRAGGARGRRPVRGRFDRILVGRHVLRRHLRAARRRADDRIAACFAVSSGYTPPAATERPSRSPGGAAPLHGRRPAEVERAITVEGVRVDVPVLQVYGGRDRITPVAERAASRRGARRAGRDGRDRGRRPRLQQRLVRAAAPGRAVGRGPCLIGEASCDPHDQAAGCARRWTRIRPFKPTEEELR